jgi:hypothetical protein
VKLKQHDKPTPHIAYLLIGQKKGNVLRMTLNVPPGKQRACASLMWWVWLVKHTACTLHMGSFSHPRVRLTNSQHGTSSLAVG